MAQVTLQYVKAERKVSAKTNKPYISSSIQVDDVWYNGFGDEAIFSWKAGETKEVELFEEEYNGKMNKKFKVPNKFDVLIAKVAELEGGIDSLQARIEKLENPGGTTTVESDPDKDDVHLEDYIF